MALKYDFIKDVAINRLPLSKIFEEARTVFAGNDIAYSHVKDSLVSWLKNFYSSYNDSDKTEILTNFAKFFDTDRRDSFHLSYLSISTIISFINTSVHTDEGCLAFLKFIDSFVHTQCVRAYFLQNDKITAEVFQTVVKYLNLEDDTCASILSFFASIYQLLGSREKAILHFIKLTPKSLAEFYCMNRNVTSTKLKATQFLKNIIFGKGGCSKFSSLLDNIFHMQPMKCKKFTALLNSFQIVLESDVESSVGFFSFVMESFASVEKVEDIAVLRLAILMAHILGIEQNVLVEIKGEKVNVLNSEFLSNQIEVSNVSDDISIQTWESVMAVISQRSLRLRGDIVNGVSGVQWFRASLISLLDQKVAVDFQLVIICHLLTLNSSIIEPIYSSIFSWVFNMNEKFADPNFLHAYHNFLDTSLETFKRLHRVHKLISKFLQSLSTVTEDIDPSQLISKSFLENISVTTTTLASSYAMIILESLFDFLKQAIDKFENETFMCTPYLHVTSDLLSAVLRGARLLCFTLPRSIVATFESKFARLKGLLTRFGTLILLRPHDRKIMQPFLRVCHVWGEMQVMISCYGIEDSPPSLPKDSSPSDLSPLHSYISGDQWTVFAERITNFGDYQCNELLLKLIVQKVGVAVLSGERSEINREATAKYITARLHSDVRNLKLKNVMQAEEFSIILNELSHDDAKKIVAQFSRQLENCDDGTYTSWLQKDVLLNNEKFVLNLFESTIKSILDCDLPNLSYSSKKLILCLQKRELIELSSNSSFLNKVKVAIEEALVEENGVCSEDNVHFCNVAKILCRLPVSSLVDSFSCAPLLLVTGVMVAINNTNQLLPTFKELLNKTEDVSAYLDTSLLVPWLLRHVSNKLSRTLIIELILLKATSTPDGVKQFQQLVSVFTGKKCLGQTEMIEAQVLVHNSIRKCFGTGKRYAETNDVLGQQKQALTRSLKKQLKNHSTEIDSSCALLNAFAIELMNSDRNGNVKKIVSLNFNTFFKKALTGAKCAKDNDDRRSCLNFLTTVLKCITNLRKELNYDLVFTIWTHLKNEPCEDLWPFICKAASEREFKKIMNDLLDTVQSGLEPPTHEKENWRSPVALPIDLRPLVTTQEETKPCLWSPNSISIWKTFLVTATGKNQMICRETVNQLVNNPCNILPSNISKNLLSWLKFLHTCASCPGSLMPSTMQDYFVDVLTAVPCNTFCHNEYIACIDLLSDVVHSRSGLFKEKVPIIFQIYAKLLNWLVRESDMSRTLLEEDVNYRVISAFRFEKLTAMLTKQDVGRELCFFISELVNCLTLVTLFPAVKFHIKGSLFNLLSHVNEHTVQFLLRILPSGSQEVFSHSYNQFQRYYKFKGKI